MNYKRIQKRMDHKETKKQEKTSIAYKRLLKQCFFFALFVAVNFISVTQPVLASSTGIVTSGMKNLQDIVAAFVSSVGSIIVLWGLFEFGNALQSNDGMMQSAAFKRIGGGLIMTIGPQLLSVLVQ